MSTWYDDDEEYDTSEELYEPLTDEETKAIASLKRLAKKWPKSLWLYSASGTLCVMKKNAEGDNAMRSGNGEESVDQRYTVAHIEIENDGGDW